jgi:hypothetical protein
LSPQRDPPRGRTGPKVRELYLSRDGPTHSWWRHDDPCLEEQRSLRGASLGSAVPGGYCHTVSISFLVG